MSLKQEVLQLLAAVPPLGLLRARREKARKADFVIESAEGAFVLRPELQPRPEDIAPRSGSKT